MKIGTTLERLASEVQRRREEAKDYKATAAALTVGHERHARATTSEAGLVLRGFNGDAYPVGPYAQRQLGSWAGIPAAYWDRMATDAPGLLVANVNEWLGRATGERRLVRTLDGRVRAWLSSSYRPLDNADLLEAALPALARTGTEVASCEITDTRLYVKVVLPSLRREVPGSRTVGDVVEAGIVLSNSEVGAGSLRIEPFVHRLVCLNGMIVNDAVMRRAHLGGRGSDVEGVEALVSDRTRGVKDVALWNRVRDVVTASFRPEVFEARVAKLGEAAQDALPAGALGRLDKVVEVVARRTRLPEAMHGSILGHLASGGDFSRWGVANAITRAAADVDDYEAATEAERAGGDVVLLTPRDWNAVTAEVLRG